jgi:hypothetical protein
VADDSQIEPSSITGRTQAASHRHVLRWHGHHRCVLHSLRRQMSEPTKPLAQETDIETLRHAVEEYQWLAKVLFKSLGCGCNAGHDLCWNCTQAERHYKLTTEIYK